MAISEKEAVELFQEFLRFRSESGNGPKGAYEECCVWLERFAARMGLPCERHTFVENKPIIVITWEGSEPDLPALILNSHYDVVPCFPTFWKNDPWAATRLEDGTIVGRGTQDMKSVCVQYLLAIQRLKAAGKTLRRTVHLTYVPDEEIGGTDAMGKFAPSEAFTKLNAGLVLDEGIANPGNPYTVFYGERTPWWIIVKAEGATGHGSRFIQGTAVSKLLSVADKAMKFRAEQEMMVGFKGIGCAHCQAKKLGDVTTLNLTMLQAGVSLDGGQTYALNVIPNQCEAGFDIRIPPSVPTEDIKAKLTEWCTEEGLTWDFAPWTSPLHSHHVTSTNSEDNFWWGHFEGACKALELELELEVFPAATDSRFVRQLGIPALGFSPMNHTEVLLHDHNECLHEKVFLRGVELYESIVSELANAPLNPQEMESSQAKKVKVM